MESSIRKDEPAKLKVDGLAPSDVDFMPPLLRSLASLIRLKGGHVSPQFLLAGLAGAERVSVAACLRAAERAGLKARVVKRRFEDISLITYPCILLLRGDVSCVLTRVETDPDGTQKAHVLHPDLGDEAQVLPLDDLLKDYSGYAILGALESRADARTNLLKTPRPKRWFWDVLKHYAPIYGHVAGASVVINSIAVVSSLFVMNVYDRVIPNNAHDTLWVLAAGVAAAFVFDYALRALRSHFVDLAGRNADVVLSSMLVDKVLSMRMDAKPESTGALVNNLREFESLREFFSSSTFLALIDLPFLLLFLLLIWYIGGPIVLVPLLAMPVLLGVTFFVERQARESAEKSYRHNMQKNALLVEMVNGLETVKSAMAESRMQRLWEAVSGISAMASNRTRKYSNRIVNFSIFLTHMVTVSLVVWGVYRIGEGEMSLGGLIGCNILLGRTMAPLMQMATLLSRMQNFAISLKALTVLMQLPSENQDEAACMDFGNLNGEFVLDKVSFTYPGATAKSLDNVSLTIRPGEKIGIIGRMGSGKSTLGKLLIGLYTPQEGSVTFGGVDVRQLAVSDLRSRIGVLPQEVLLFYGTIRDNIALGDPTINDQLVRRAGIIAGVDNFVRRYPAGYGTQVGEQGRNLSGGQRQAVCLARALVRDPAILVLDEPTSNMDVESEQHLQRTLTPLLREKTVVLFTHRLSMLQMVDRLIVMHNGRIVMDGPRKDVLQKMQTDAREKVLQAARAARHKAEADQAKMAAQAAAQGGGTTGGNAQAKAAASGVKEVRTAQAAGTTEAGHGSR